MLGHSYASIRGGGNLKGATPFILASMVGDTEMMRLLLTSGADPLLTTADRTTGLMLASGLGAEPWETLVPMESRLAAATLCVDLGQDINAANDRGTTALHATVYLGVDPVAEFLLDRGARINANNARGETPLQIAQGYSLHLSLAVHDSTAELLRRRGGIADSAVAGE